MVLDVAGDGFAGVALDEFDFGDVAEGAVGVVDGGEVCEFLLNGEGSAEGTGAAVLGAAFG